MSIVSDLIAAGREEGRTLDRFAEELLLHLEGRLIALEPPPAPEGSAVPVPVNPEVPPEA